MYYLSVVGIVITFTLLKDGYVTSPLMRKFLFLLAEIFFMIGFSIMVYLYITAVRAIIDHIIKMNPSEGGGNAGPSGSGGSGSDGGGGGQSPNNSNSNNGNAGISQEDRDRLRNRMRGHLDSILRRRQQESNLSGAPFNPKVNYRQIIDEAKEQGDPFS